MEEDKKINQQENESCEVTETKEVVEEKPEKSTPKKGKKAVLFTIIAVVVLAAVAAFIFLSGKGNVNPVKTQAEAGIIEARINTDGSAYLPLYDGNCIEIKDEVDCAGITSDRNHIVCLLEDGVLYVTDLQQTEKKIIAENCKEIKVVRDSGLLYIDKNENLNRVLFADLSIVKIGKNFAFKVADDSMSLICADKDGHVYKMSENESELVKCGNYEDSITVNGISNDGYMCVWTNATGNNTTIYLCEGDERFKLGEVNSKYSGTDVSFTADQKMAVVTNIYSESLWIKKVGEEPVRAKLGAQLALNLVLTDKGELDDVNSADVKGIYVSVDADNLNNIYYINVDGDRERVLNSSYLLSVNNGNIIYYNEDGLYYAKVNGAELEEEKKISSEASNVISSKNGRYVYYFKNVDDGSGALYCYKIGEDDAQKVTGDAASSSVYLYETIDGSGLLFFRDNEKIGDKYTKQGTLYSWAYGDEEIKKITSEVITSSIDGGYEDSVIELNSFTYLKYNSIDKEDNIYGDLFYYDGNESVKLAEDVLY